MAEKTVAYKATMNRMGIYIQEEQVDEYLAAGYTVYKITTEVLEAVAEAAETETEVETATETEGGSDATETEIEAEDEETESEA